VGSNEKASLVERSDAEMGWQRCARLQSGFEAERPHGSVHHESGGVGRIFAPLAAFADAPLPEHYEPIESPIDNPLHAAQSHNPVVKRFKTPEDKYGTPKDGYTVVCTTYRMTEHYHYWTKNNPMNVQLVPEPFVEISVKWRKRWASLGARR